MPDGRRPFLFNEMLRKKLWQGFIRQSLTVKLVGALSFVVCLIVIVGTIAFMNITKKAIAETSVTTALYQAELLKGKLIDTMFINGETSHKELEGLLQDEKKMSRLDEINVFNSKGEVRFSSSTENLRKKIRVHMDPLSHFTSSDALIEFDNLNEAGRLRILHPIRGGVQCAACHHNAIGELLGGIELFVPLGPIYKRFAVNRFVFLFSAFAIIVFGAFLIRWLIQWIVKNPIRKLAHVMEKAEKGELDVRTRIYEDPELHRLARSFNSMVRGIDKAQKRIGEQYQKELAQSNRLASLGQFISNVSHEVKNPLAAISSALHALRSEFQTVENQEIFQELTLQVERIERTVTNLLRYARQEPPQFNPCPMTDPVRQALDLAGASLQKNKIQVKIDCKTEETSIWGDAGQLEQVFLNLFLNAASAMPDGGILRIGIRRVQASDTEDFRNLPQGPGLSVEVEDTGVGIRSEDLPRLFEPFFTTKLGGTGLGLSVVKGIVEAHEGTIRIQSVLDKGTTVAILFPVLEEQGARTETFRATNHSV